MYLVRKGKRAEEKQLETDQVKTYDSRQSLLVYLFSTINVNGISGPSENTHF